MEEKKEPYIQIPCHMIVNLLTPDYSRIPLNCLASAISNLNRFTGHVGPYSVAQHSVHVMELVQFDLNISDRPPTAETFSVLRGALLHDLHEAVIGDISTPVKDAMAEMGFDFREKLEARHIAEVEKRWDTTTTDPRIKRADLKMALAEADRFLGGRVGPWAKLEAAKITLPCWTPEQGLSEFMRHASLLGIE